MGTTLTLELYAELRAEMESAYSRDDVLARAGLTTDEWTGVQREWLAKMGAEIAKSQFELTNRYSQAFLDRQRALTQAAPKVVDAPVAPFIGVVPRASSSASVKESAPPVVEALPPPESAPPVTIPQGTADRTVIGGFSLRDLGLPFRPASPDEEAASMTNEAPQPESTQPITVPQGAAADATSVYGFSPPAAALPFRQPSSREGAVPAPPVFSAPEAPREQPTGFDASATITLSAGFARDAVLPFGSGASSGGPLSPTARREVPIPTPAPTLPEAELIDDIEPDEPKSDGFGNRTMFALDLQGATQAALPFVPPPATPITAAALRRGSISSVLARPNLPTAVPNLTLEQHASLCAELGFAPARASEILARYYITATIKADLDKQWQARFKADPALARRWYEAYQIYSDFLKSSLESER